MRSLLQYAYVNRFKTLAENPSYFNRWVVTTYEPEFVSDYLDQMIGFRAYTSIHWSTRLTAVKSLVHKLEENGVLIETL